MRLSRQELACFTADFVSAHLSGLRSGAVVPDALTTEQSGDFTAAPWFMDSLELTTLSGMFSDALSITESGQEDLLLARRSIEQWADIAAFSLAHYDEQLSFFTSGSTGMPKKTQHAVSLLEEETTALTAIIQPHAPLRIVSTVPSHHIYGFLFSLLLPHTLSLPCVQQRGTALQLHEGDMLIAVPARIRQWRMRNIAFPPRTFIISSTAPLPADDAAWLLDSDIGYLEVFGSSETAGIGTRSHPDEAFQLLPYWQPTGNDISRPGLSAPVAMPDRVKWVSQDSFLPLGRRDDAVQVGGINVFPQQVAEQLQQLSYVQQAAVRPFESTAGTRLKAFIVPTNTAETAETAVPDHLEALLRNWAAAHLPSPQRPAHYRFGEQLPRTPLGKPADWDTQPSS